jgi:two-component system phosphate regulon sensor histidine kinase PhoR
VLSLRARLVAGHVLVAIGALSAFAALAYREQRERIIDREAAALELAALAAAPGVEAAAATARSWPAVADAMGRALGMRVTLIAGDGTVLGDSHVPAERLPRVENHAGRPEVRAALSGAPGRATRRSATVGGERLYVAVPVRAAPVAVLRLSDAIGRVADVQRSLLRASLLAGLAALLFAAGVGAWLSGRQVRRLSEMEGIAVRIGADDRQARAREVPQDEIGRLGRALNTMAAELRGRLDALRRERDERERILAHMSDGVALIDAGGRIVRCNLSLAAILDAPLPAAPGTPFREFVRSPELDELIARARGADRPAELDLRLWTPRPRLVGATAIPLDEGGRGSVLLVLRDLSEVEALNRVRQDFVANVSHELRTPLTSLRGYAETLLEGGLEDAEHREGFVRVIRDQTARLQALVEDLLSLSELERPGARLRLELFDLRETVERLVGIFRAPAEAARLGLEVAPGGPVPVTADRTRIEQVLANLLDNAIKYTERGRVTLSVGGDAAWAWCEVADTGPGIPGEDQPRIFERFYRVDKARSREQGGTGLGLSIVKHILSLHGGEVAVHSVPGEGSRFTIRIPRTPVGTRPA